MPETEQAASQENNFSEHVAAANDDNLAFSHVSLTFLLFQRTIKV